MRYVVAVVLLLAGLGTIGYAGWRAMGREERLRGETVATVVEVVTEFRSQATHRRAKVRFVADGQTYETWSAFDSSASWTEGDEVPVRYDPGNPADASLREVGQTHVVSWVLGAFGLVSMLLSALAFVLARERSRRRREEPSFLR